MDRKELYQNVRKAYRLAYEVQDSIVSMVEYIRHSKIKYDDCAGKPLFSKAIAKRKNVEDGYVTDNIGQDMWSWDYFPTYMYMYYFTLPQTDTQYCYFSIVQVMDDGFIGAPDEESAPSTKDFSDITDSESYFLFCFSITKKDQRATWFEFSGTEPIDDERKEIIRISEEIKNKGNEPYIVNTATGSFIVVKINAESIGCKEEAAKTFQNFSELVYSRTGYQLLVDESEILNP